MKGLVGPDTTRPEVSGNAIVFEGTNAEYRPLIETFRGTQAVCAVSGPRAPYVDVFCAAATRAISEAMRQAGCLRLICQTGAMTGSDVNRSWGFERMTRAFARRHPEAATYRIEQEHIVTARSLDWTIVRPPRLTHSPKRGSVRAGPALKVGLTSHISRLDLATFILDETEQPRFPKQSVCVKH